MKTDHPHILCIADGPDWVFNRHIEVLKHFLGEDFEFHTAFRFQPFDESAYDLIYPLEFDMIRQDQILNPQKYVTGMRSFVSWADWNFLELVNYLSSHFQSVHAVSQQLLDVFLPYLPSLSYVTHGVDTDRFSPSLPPKSASGQLRLGWAGNRNTFVKGFRNFIRPLGEIAGVELVYYGFADQKLPPDDMPGFYDSIDAYISASSFEGNSNTLLEAAAMERPIITTAAGTVPEFLVDEQSALIVERDLDMFKTAVVRLRDNPDLRHFLGKNARQAVIDGGWDWQSKAGEYRVFFEHALAKSDHEVQAAPISHPVDYQHYASVLEMQFQLEREMRFGFAYQASDLGYTNQYLQDELTNCGIERQALKQELSDIKGSETYRTANVLKDSVIGKWFIWLYRRLSQ